MRPPVLPSPFHRRLVTLAGCALMVCGPLALIGCTPKAAAPAACEDCGPGDPGGGGPGGPGGPKGGPDDPLDGGTGTGTGATPDAGTPPPLPFGGGDWSAYRYDLAGTWHNPGRLNSAQAKAGALQWTAPLGAYGWTEPVLAHGTVYATMGFSGTLFALDAATGGTKWSRELNHVFKADCDTEEKHHGFFASATVVGDTVYAASGDGNLYALDAHSGATLWQAQVADPNYLAEFVQSSPTVSTRLGKVFLGVGSSIHCAHAEGRVMSVDLSTHAVLRRELNPPGVGGSSVWSSIAVDEDAGRIYVTTGDPAGHALSDVPYAQAILAMDAQSLEILDSWQNPGPAPDANSDFGASPTLFELPDGTKMVAAPNKDGVVYALNRDALAAGPVWTYRVAVAGAPTDGLGSLVAPTYTRGTLYVAGGKTVDGEPGSVAALDPATGAVKWKHVTPGFVLAAMPAVGDVLFVSSSKADYSKSWLEVLSLDTGEVVTSWDADTASWGAPAVGQGTALWLLFSGDLRAYHFTE